MLRSDCTDAADVSCAYAAKKFLRKVRQLPWSLAIGDMSGNLDTLAAGMEPGEQTASKIWKLLQLGCNRAELVDAVAMLRECRWSTVLAEQLHGTTAAIHKLHKELGEAVLTARSMVGFMKPLFATDRLEKHEAATNQHLERMSCKMPSRENGRSHFIGSFVNQVKRKRDASGGTFSIQLSRTAFRAGSSQYAALDAPAQEACRLQAQSAAEKKQASLHSDLAHVESKLSLMKQRHSEELRQEGVASRLSACRLSEAQVQQLQSLWASSLSEDVRESRNKALLPPKAPKPAACAALRSVHVPDEAYLAHIPDWCKKIATHRALFSSCALVFQSDASRKSFAFLYAEQSSIDVAMVALRACSSRVEDPISSSVDPLLEDYVHFDHTFVFEWCDYVWGRSMRLQPGEEVFVLPHLVRWDGKQLKSHANLLPLEDFLKGLPDPIPKRSKKDDNESFQADAPIILVGCSPLLTKGKATTLKLMHHLLEERLAMLTMRPRCFQKKLSK